MYLSKFTLYTGSVTGGNPLNGTSGSLLQILDACLVYGYSGSAPAGWTKPLPNTGSWGCYQQGTGSGLILFVNDAGQGAAGVKEARMQGWTEIFSIFNGAVTGSNQFPTPLQQTATAYGSLMCRKTSSLSTSGGYGWRLFVDSSSLYLYTLADSPNTCSAFFFGDIYSVRSSSVDNNKCIIIGKHQENTSGNENLDAIAAFTTNMNGHYASHTLSGQSFSSLISKHGDTAKGNSSFFMTGNIPYPNPVDGGLYMSPMWICDNSTAVVRGKMRGFYEILHAPSNFNDGDVFSGSGDYAGRTFIIVKQSLNGALYCMETSATIETN